MIDLQFNYPILEGQYDEFAKHIRDAVAASPGWMELPPYGGGESHRRAAAEWLSRGGTKIDAGRVMLAAGGHSGVMATLLTAGLRGTAVAVEKLTYPGFKLQAEALGIELVACEIDKHGIVPQSLEEAARRKKISSVYVMPTVHNPTGSVQPIERREEIVEIARKYDFTIIDDDAYRFCEAEAPPSYAHLAPERSYFIESFTKPYAPAMKVAFVAFPPEKSAAMEAALRCVSSGAPALFAEVACRLIRSGDMEHLLIAKRQEGAARQELAREELEGLSFTAHPTSFHVWIDLPKDRSSDEVAERLKTDGILATAGRFHAATSAVQTNSMRVALGAVRDMNELRLGLRRVKEHIVQG